VIERLIGQLIDSCSGLV